MTGAYAGLPAGLIWGVRSRSLPLISAPFFLEFVGTPGPNTRARNAVSQPRIGECLMTTDLNTGDGNADALVLARRFWPRALTLVLPRKTGCRLSALVSGGLDTVALRAPAHPIASSLRFLLIAHSVVLPNLILGENVFPELLNRECNGGMLSEALLPLMRGGPERERQLAGLARMTERVRKIEGAPSERAAKIVLAYAERKDKASL